MNTATDQRGTLFLSHADTLELLGVQDALDVCEKVYAMHARGSVRFSAPPSQRLDVRAPFHNHWHVKTVLLEEIPATGVRLYNYYDDGVRNSVGSLECGRYVFLADPASGEPLAIVDEHWTYAIRSVAAAVLACKWVGPRAPKVLGLVGIGTMGTNTLRCLTAMYRFDEIRCTSRRSETRNAFAEAWSRKLGVPVIAKERIEDVVRGADIIVGGTTSGDIVSREAWVKPGATFISLARRELDPAGWRRMDKIVVDSWDVNMLTRDFRNTVESGLFSRDELYGEIQDLAVGRLAGRERDDERILVHTTGLVSHDVAIAHHVYVRAKARGVGIWLPAAG